MNCPRLPVSSAVASRFAVALAFGLYACSMDAMAAERQAPTPSGRPTAEDDEAIAISTPPRTPVSFSHDVMSVLSKAGCNAGTCHGNVNGKGGFFLSLRGQDPEFDYQQIVQVADGRRVNPIQPQESLILLKAIAAVAHQGGKRFAVGDPEYQILHAWVDQGMVSPEADLPVVTGLVTTPADQVLWPEQSSIPLQVEAEFSDGTRRDVTRLAVYESSDPLVTITPAGLVQFSQPSLTTILVRYLDGQAPVRLAYRSSAEGFRWSDPPVNNFIDHHVFARLQQLKINPASLSDDRIFIRRVYLDLLGKLPTAKEAQDFEKSTDLDKREKLVDQLLARPEFAFSWALKWSDLLRNEEKTLDATGVKKLHTWMRDHFQADRPLTQLVAALVASRGSTYENPPANYWRAHREPFVRAETTAQVFLGVRLQCAKCHNHPFDRWSQDQYYHWASLFTGIDYEIVDNRRRDRLDKHEFVGEQIVQVKAEGAVENPRSGQAASPMLLGDDAEVSGDRLEQLANWMTASDNRMFLETQVNRIWYQLMGVGLVDPIDDLRATNPASHPDLLNQLVDQWIADEFRLKPLIRTILLSTTYQLAAEFDSPQLEANEYDERLFARAVIKRLTAEQIADTQSQVLDLPANFAGYAQGVRAGEIAGVRKERGKLNSGDVFLKQFGKPERLLACECERSDEPALTQALMLVGGAHLQERLSAPGNRIGRLLQQSQDHQAIIEDLYWTALTRSPSADELDHLCELIDQSDNPRRVLEDLVWALLNAKELLFRN